MGLKSERIVPEKRTLETGRQLSLCWGRGRRGEGETPAVTCVGWEKGANGETVL